jgi:hypothetical protein
MEPALENKPAIGEKMLALISSIDALKTSYLLYI